MWNETLKKKEYVVKVKINFGRVKKILHRLARAVGWKVE